jgi:2-dehydro-3-deoxyphosphogluconate aldolase/(4S)-4-hydroxy-2-oxoglutarate aldolase
MDKRRSLHQNKAMSKGVDTHNEVFAAIHRFGVVPVVTVERLEQALPLADALIEGGLPIAEVTFRTPAAAEVIDCLVRERPQLLVGAGTVLSLDNVRAAKKSGARFAVAPGLNPEVVTEAQKMGLAMIPGVATASEIERGLFVGCRVLKLFPAALLGGPDMVAALSGPFAHKGVKFMPSSGVSGETLSAYLALPTVTAVGGTWIASKDTMAAGDWPTIRARAREASQIVLNARRPHSSAPAV